MKRRQFCGLFSLGAMASCFPLILAACSSSNSGDSQNVSLNNNNNSSNKQMTQDGFVVAGTSQELSQNGALLGKTAQGEPFIVVKDTENNIHAVNSFCTHRGCHVGWQQDTKDLYCACHGSRFSLDGAVTKGPATEPLAEYQVKEENGSILIKA